MQPNSDPPKAKADLKSLLMPEVEMKLHALTDGLSQAEAQLRLTQCSPKKEL